MLRKSLALLIQKMRNQNGKAHDLLKNENDNKKSTRNGLKEKERSVFDSSNTSISSSKSKIYLKANGFNSKMSKKSKYNS